MKKNFKCELLSWEKTRELSEIVAGKIIDSGYFADTIIAITRGGWVPAMNLSDALGIKDMFSLKVEHWGITATPDKTARLMIPLNVDISKKRILLVDDLTDTGESIRVSLEYLKKLNPMDIRTATLIHKKQSKFEPDYFAEKTGDWKWIILPWNITEDLCNLVKQVLCEGGDRKEDEWKISPDYANVDNIDLHEIQTKLKKNFDLIIDKKALNEILPELKRRSML